MEKSLKERVALALRSAADALETKETKKPELTKVEMMAESPLSDGTIVMTPADEFAQGVEVFVTTSEGEQIPLAVGEYTFEDGRVIIVEQEGVIAEINTGETAEDNGEVEAEKESNANTQKEVKSIVESVVKEMKFSETIEALKKENETLKQQLSKEAETRKENENVVVNLAEQLADLQKPAETGKVKHQDTPSKSKSKKTSLSMADVKAIKDPVKKAAAIRQMYS